MTHKLLARQVAKYLRTPVASVEGLRPLLEAVDAAYRHHDDDRALLERSSELMSRELQERNSALERDVALRIRALESLRRSEQRFRAIFDHSPVGLVLADVELRIAAVNPAFARFVGQTCVDLEGRSWFELLHPDDLGAAAREVRALFSGAEHAARWEARFRRPDGGDVWGKTSLVLVSEGDEGGHVYAMVTDEDARRRTEAREAQMEVQLRQAQKLEGIGQLAAGIAHEINTPTQFVGDNLAFLQRAVAALVPGIEACQRLLASDEAASCRDAADVRAALARARAELLVAEIPKAVDQALEGVRRVAAIVQAMKTFAHPGGAERRPTDLARAIESTLVVARNEWRYVAEAEPDVEPGLPLVPCYADELNQVLLILIVNAAQAIAEKSAGDPERRGRIAVRAQRSGDFVEIRVVDTGCGIPEPIRSRVFEPFFTTKPVGRGSGQGLAIAHAVMVKHGGTIAVESEVGRGTTIVLRLPLDVAGRGRGQAA